MWAQVLCAALGIWLMAAPAVFGYVEPAATNDRIFGPIVATFAIVSWWEATRGVRLANLPVGAWLLVAPWILGYADTPATLNSSLVGMLIVACAFVKGKIKNSYGGGWKSVFMSGSSESRQGGR